MSMKTNLIENEASFQVEGFTPGQDGSHYNQSEWTSWLTRYFPEFACLAPKAGSLLCEFFAGVHLTLSTYEPAISCPQIGFFEELDAMDAPIFYDSTNKMFHIQRRFLLKFAGYDMKTIYDVTRSDGERFFCGYCTDFFKLLGCEEADHTLFYNNPLFYNNHPQTRRLSNALSKRLAEAESVDIEYHALLWQLEVAQKSRMPRYTISLLEQKVERAKSVRRGRGLSLQV